MGSATIQSIRLKSSVHTHSPRNVSLVFMSLLGKGQRVRDISVSFTTADLMLKKPLVPSGHLTTIYYC